MTAEEYINKHRLKSAISSSFDEIFFDSVKEGIEMARNEEREKALMAYQKMVSICQNCKDVCSHKCGTDCLVNKFKELLNE